MELKLQMHEHTQSLIRESHYNFLSYIPAKDGFYTYL